MAIGAEPLSSQPLKPPSTSGGNDAGDFECNICFELAQDPIVTLCGHLFCWPCLYRWLRLHSQSHDCPVCKALIDEEKLVPLYGRGKTPATDPRLKPVPGIEIPNRPAGQRPQTPSLPNFGYGLAGFRNFAMSAGFGGLIPPLLNIQFHGFPYALYGAQSGLSPNAFSGPIQIQTQTYPNGGIIRGRHQQQQQHQQADYYLKMLFFLIGLFVVIALF